MTIHLQSIGQTRPTIRIGGITYEVVKVRTYQFRDVERTALRLRRPNGKKFYEAVQYENGSLSSAVPCPF